ncbi:hypothetical protein DFJ77DRAFT_470223 [Powellomyces hirtus]|nr:hypothetical protein DFJ77DRAFT_470223 [Powellomyces hirtus]
MSAGILQNNIGPHLGFYPGEYNTTIAPRTVSKPRKRDDTVVVSAVDLRYLTQQIDGDGIEAKLLEMQKADRDRRHQLSKNRIANWDNTYAGTRRRRLQARMDRLEAEEAERVRIDKEYAFEEAQRRIECIARAKQLQYAETDMVKNFHSKVILFETLQERDMQLELKKQVAGADKAIDQGYYMATCAEVAAGNKRDMLAEIEKRKRGVLVQNVQREQAKEKRARDALEEKRGDTLENTLITGSHFASQDATLERKRAQQAAFREDLKHQQRDAVQRAEAAAAEEAARANAAEKWVTRKKLQVAKKKEMERECRAKAMKRKQQSGEEAARKAQEAEARIDAAVVKAMQEREVREQSLQRTEAAKRWKAGEDLAESYRDHVNRAEAANKARIEDEAATLRGYLAIEAATLAERRTKVEDARRKGKELQESHVHDMAQHRLNRQAVVQNSLKEAAELASTQQDELNDLHTYMRSLANEPWAKPNTRLQLYVDAETAPKISGPTSAFPPGDHRGWVDTGRRLGFPTRESQLAQQRQQQQQQHQQPPVVVVRPTVGAGPASRPQSCAKLVRGDTLNGRTSASSSRPGSSGKNGAGLGITGLPALPTRA